jgi:TonB family protein
MLVLAGSPRLIAQTPPPEGAKSRPRPDGAQEQGEISPELKPYVEAVMKSVKQKWYEMIAFLPKKKFDYMGNLEIEFTVQRDGSVTNMKPVSLSGDRDLDKIAWEAIRQLSPFAPFPDAAKDKSVLLRIQFRYNHGVIWNRPAPTSSRALRAI